MHMEARMFCQPRLDLGMLVGGVVVQCRSALDETAIPWWTVPLHAVADMESSAANNCRGMSAPRSARAQAFPAERIVSSRTGGAPLYVNASSLADERKLEVLVNQLCGLRPCAKFTDPLHAGVAEVILDGTGHLGASGVSCKVLYPLEPRSENASPPQAPASAWAVTLLLPTNRTILTPASPASAGDSQMHANVFVIPPRALWETFVRIGTLAWRVKVPPSRPILTTPRPYRPLRA